MPEESWNLTHYNQLSFWGTGNRFPGTNNNNQRSSPTKAEDRQNPRKGQIFTIQESTSKIHWILELLSKAYI